MGRRQIIPFNNKMDTNYVRNLFTLKEYLERFGCSQFLQQRLKMTKKQIMTVSKLRDMKGCTANKSISLGKKDFQQLRDISEISASF